MSSFAATGISSSSNTDGLAGVSLVDSHCHLQLSPLYERSAAVIASAQQHASISFASVCGVSPGEDWSRVEALAETHKDVVVPGFGLHPWWIRRFFDLHGSGNPLPHTDVCLETSAGSPAFDAYAVLEQELREVLGRHASASVGECGLDKNIKHEVQMLVQEAVLLRHLRVANDLRRTVVLHCVGAWGRLQEQLSAAASSFPNIPAIVLHSANSIDPALLPMFSRMPRVFYSFTAVGHMALADEKQEQRRQKVVRLVRAVPRDKLLLETDSPDQVPAALRVLLSSAHADAVAGGAGGHVGGDNTAPVVPAMQIDTDTACEASPYVGLQCNELAVIRYTCADVAAVLGMPAAELAALTTRNARAAFGRC